MTHRRVTIDDIARESNASPTTVSLVLRDKPGIGVETRRRVLAAAQSLGYQRRNASRLASSGTVLNVGLIMRARARDQLIGHGNAFYSWVLVGVEAAARTRSMNLLYSTLSVDDHNVPIDFPDHLLAQELDAVLLVGPVSDQTLAEVAGHRGTPIVLVDGPRGDHSSDSVVSDNESGAYTAVKTLVGYGHQKIAYVGPKDDVDPNFRQRHDGYRRAMQEHGLTPQHAVVGSDDQIREAARAYLAHHTDTTALFGAYDLSAIAAMRGAIDLGRRVPEDLSVMGFDDIEMATQTEPPLTTMAIDKISMGRLAVNLLAHRLAWPESATIQTTIRPRLIIRESVGPAS